MGRDIPLNELVCEQGERKMNGVEWVGLVEGWIRNRGLTMIYRCTWRYSYTPPSPCSPATFSEFFLAGFFSLNGEEKSTDSEYGRLQLMVDIKSNEIYSTISLLLVLVFFCRDIFSFFY